MDWGVAAASIDGLAPSGDAFYAHDGVGGTLLAVIDGLGHGEAAAVASSSVIETLDRNRDARFQDLVLMSDRSQHGLRGAVMSMARISPERGQLSWLGVGNVSGVLLSDKGYDNPYVLPLRPGIIGSNLPLNLDETVVRFQPGDALVMATDGVDIRGLRKLPPETSDATAIADFLLNTCRGRKDDRLVLVALL